MKLGQQTRLLVRSGSGDHADLAPRPTQPVRCRVHLPMRGIGFLHSLAWWGSVHAAVRLGTSRCAGCRAHPDGLPMASRRLDHLSGVRHILRLQGRGRTPSRCEGWYGPALPPQAAGGGHREYGSTSCARLARKVR